MLKELNSWFAQPGAYVLVDGQFGSTGKGVMAALMAEIGKERITHVTTNAGPNSGHTAYWRNDEGGYDRVMTQQVPVASVFLRRMGYSPVTLLNAGAVIDPHILGHEAVTHKFNARDLIIHPTAALISKADYEADRATLNAVASTGKGVGPAMMRKMSRLGASEAQHMYMPWLDDGRPQDRSFDRYWDWGKDVVFVETAQGFSLGLNSYRFYPCVTSRECTVMQAISDARIPAQQVRGVVACFRTFPIRVGNTSGSSGDCYPDQHETTWEAIGQPPELTTVTKRVRRVFSWSRLQFKDAVAANEPDVLFLNFANYLTINNLTTLLRWIYEDYASVMGSRRPCILLGYSEHHEDIRVVEGVALGMVTTRPVL